MGVDTAEKHGGKSSAYIEHKPGESKGGFATMSQGITAEAYRGKRIRLSAFLKSKDVESAGLWMRVDSGERIVSFDNMMERPVKGTTDWQRYEITLDVPEDATVIPYGFLLLGKGRVWGDDFRLEVVGPEVRTTNMEAAVKQNAGNPRDPQAEAHRKRFLDGIPASPVNLDFEQF